MHSKTTYTPSKHQHLPVLTGLRGFAAIWIVLHNYSGWFLITTNDYFKQFTPFLSNCYLWVDFFFILSGFVLAHVYQQTFSKTTKIADYRIFLRSRLARIYPLHLITLFFLIGIELTRLYLSHNYGMGDLEHPPFSGKHSIESIFTNIFLLQAFHEWTYWNEPAWAVSTEWIFYLALPLLLFLSKRTIRLIDIGVILIGLLALYLLASHNNGLDFVSWRSIVRCYVEATIGILAYKMTFRQIPTHKCRPWHTTLLLVCCLTAMATQINQVIIVLLFVLLICSAAKVQNHYFLTSRFMLFLGTISYSIYMTHKCVQDILQMFSFSMTGKSISYNTTLTQQMWLLFILVILVILIAAFCYSWIEEPLRKRFSTPQIKKTSDYL